MYVDTWKGSRSLTIMHPLVLETVEGVEKSHVQGTEHPANARYQPHCHCLYREREREREGGREGGREEGRETDRQTDR